MSSLFDTYARFILLSLSSATCLKNGIEAEMTLLGLAGVSWWPHHHSLHVAQSPLVVAVIRIYTRKDNVRGDSSSEENAKDSKVTLKEKKTSKVSLQEKTMSEVTPQEKTTSKVTPQEKTMLKTQR